MNIDSWSTQGQSTTTGSVFLLAVRVVVRRLGPGPAAVATLGPGGLEHLPGAPDEEDRDGQGQDAGRQRHERVGQDGVVEDLGHDLRLHPRPADQGADRVDRQEQEEGADPVAHPGREEGFGRVGLPDPDPVGEDLVDDVEHVAPIQRVAGGKERVFRKDYR